jgi:hypothetical protein
MTVTACPEIIPVVVGCHITMIDFCFPFVSTITNPADPPVTLRKYIGWVQNTVILVIPLFGNPWIKRFQVVDPMNRSAAPTIGAAPPIGSAVVDLILPLMPRIADPSDSSIAER